MSVCLDVLSKEPLLGSRNWLDIKNHIVSKIPYGKLQYKRL